jgi:uncharacterized membrane protein (Fun14 family)
MISWETVAVGGVAGLFLGYAVKKVGKIILLLLTFVTGPVLGLLGWQEILRFDSNMLWEKLKLVPGYLPMEQVQANLPQIGVFAAAFILGFKRG